jgi:hypothetical protein
MSTLRTQILYAKESKYYLVTLTEDLSRLWTDTFHYISPADPPPNLDLRTLLICEVLCSLFKDCFQTRVYCLVLLVVARLVLLMRGFPLESGPVTITTCPEVTGMCISHPLNRFRCFRVTGLWPRRCGPEMDAWRDG